MLKWLLKGIAVAKANWNIRTALLLLLGLALLMWDWVTLPLYGATRFSILFIPVLCSFLLGLSVLLHYYVVNQKKRDPVRRSHRSFTWDLVVLMVLNLLGFILFFKAWLFVSPWLRGLGLGLTFINFLVGFTLMLVFGMGWHRFEFQDTNLRKAYIENLNKFNGHWYNLPASAVGNQKLGWANPSALIIDTLYQKFQQLFLESVQKINEGYFDKARQPEEAFQFHWHQTKRTMEQAFKMGHLIAMHCDLFDDKNGNHHLLASQIYWKLINAHLLQLALWQNTPQAPASALKHELEDLQHLCQFFKAKTETVKETLTDQAFASTWAAWEEDTLKRRLSHFYLNAVYAIQYGNIDEDKKEALKQHLQSEIFEEIGESIQQFKRQKEHPVNPEHFIRQISAQLDLPSPVLELYALLNMLQSKEPNSEQFFSEDFSQWQEIPYAVEGIKVKNSMDLDITRLLMITPPIQQQDMEAKTTDFETLWQCAGLVWLLQDFVFFEQEFPKQYFLEFLNQLEGDLRKFPYAIRKEIRDLSESIIFKTRKQEAKWTYLHRTQDLIKMIQ